LTSIVSLKLFKRAKNIILSLLNAQNSIDVCQYRQLLHQQYLYHINRGYFKKKIDFLWEITAIFHSIAEGGSRTLTLLPGRDFESRASANSATSALWGHIIAGQKAFVNRK
jgi:hypothetical protein